MLTDAELRELAEVSAQERAFLSVYLRRPQSVAELEKKLPKLRRLLKGGGAAKDEREHFDENVKMVREHLDRHPLTDGSLCLFAYWAIDFLKAVPSAAPVEDLVQIDSSPYIRPLAELQEEYENVAVVVADNKKARVFLVSSAVAGDEEVVHGNVKNHVKKGGWSQQRYERRRDGQLLHYAREIVAALSELDKAESFRRIVLVGGKEILRIVQDDMPQSMRPKVAAKAVHLGKGEDVVNDDIYELFFEQERQSERDLWERIRVESLRGGLGVVGLEDVLAAARQGRVETMIVNRTFKPQGRRCRDCDGLHLEAIESCPACASTSLFEVGVVNEIVEMLQRTSAEVDFAEPIDTLTEAGEIAAFLRY